MHTKDNKTYIIIGTGSAGTSFLSKCLEDAGVSMGGDYDDKYEDRLFKEMNRTLLSRAGGNWRHSPSRKDILEVAKGLKEDIKKLIERKKGKFWGWKDPRTTLTLPVYLDLLEDDVYLIAAFRKPKRTMESMKRLHSADNMSDEELKAHYYEYIDRTIDAIKEFTKWTEE